VWPHGLEPLISHVRSLGMQFGLWVEPEMISPDSDLYRAHPDWILATGGRLPPTYRHQQVLDLANPDAYDHIRSRLDALLSENDIGYLKWDHDRDLIDAGHQARPGVHAQTLAAYRLLDELRAAYPGVEIESCSSGGHGLTSASWSAPTACGRATALERQTIQRWTGLFLPPELIGTHVGPPRAHTTGRVHDLSFRATIALLGHAGIEWDISSASPEERAALASWIGFYKRHWGCCTRATSSTPTIRTLPRRWTASSPATAPRRCTHMSRRRPRGSPCPSRSGFPGSTRTAGTWSSLCIPPARRAPPSGRRRPGMPPARSRCQVACSVRSG